MECLQLDRATFDFEKYYLCPDCESRQVFASICTPGSDIFDSPDDQQIGKVSTLPEELESLPNSSLIESFNHEAAVEDMADEIVNLVNAEEGAVNDTASLNIPGTSIQNNQQSETEPNTSKCQASLYSEGKNR